MKEQGAAVSTTHAGRGQCGGQVGYLSASQFSREYTRVFGSAPTRDIATLRQDGGLAEEGARG